MLRTFAVLALCLIAWLLPATASAQDLTPRSRLSTAGLGPIKIGMTKARAQRAGGKRLVWMGPALNGCRYMRPRDRRIRASFMVVDRRIARVDVQRRGIRTVSGFRVGDAEQAVRNRFGDQLRVTPHEYVRGGWYLEVVPRDAGERNRRVVFETDGERVTYIRGGKLPEARYIEGCA
jgi:hypothetical protein